MAIYSERFRKELFAVSHTRRLLVKNFCKVDIFHFGYSVCSKSSLDTLRKTPRIDSWVPPPVIVSEVTPPILSKYSYCRLTEEWYTVLKGSKEIWVFCIFEGFTDTEGLALQGSRGPCPRHCIKNTRNTW